MGNKTTPEIFSLWLEQNKKRFNHKPIFLRKKKKFVEYFFENINPMLKLIIYTEGYNEGEIDVVVNFKQEWFDIIFNEDMIIMQNQIGLYYCELCEPDYVKFYKNKEDLLAEHSFEEMLIWANKNFVLSNILRLCEYLEYDNEQKSYFVGMTSGEIISKEKAESEDNKTVNSSTTRAIKISTHDFPVIIEG